MTEYIVFGDWRDLRGAIERAKPEFNSLSDEGRTAAWAFASALIENYYPLSFKCLHCQKIGHIREAYRCADCHAHLCGQCIRPHFEESIAFTAKAKGIPS